ncbi:hypothetical protein IKF02_00755 [Candidatus Saccharibacteria bacterium]|nr:hypothetical protein [Candidatus Saccharibacteria bacterium]
MVRRNILKINILSSFTLLAFLSSISVAPFTMATASNTQFQLDIDEVLIVSVTKPSSGVAGSTGDFLRNTVGLEVTTNNGNGFTAFMTTKTTTPDLTNTFSADTIPTLSSNTTRSNFPNDRWGYSLSNTSSLASWSSNTPDDASGVGNSTYKPLVGSSSTPVTVLRAESTASSSQSIYFGAKASSSSDSGTYTNTVVISVVSGISTENNVPAPENPVTPADDTVANNNTGTYVAAGSDSGATVYNYTSSSNGNDTTTTIVTEGDTHTVEYTAPQGVFNIIEGTPLATGLAITAAIAATSGAFFFILAKRKKDEEEDEDEDYYDY